MRPYFFFFFIFCTEQYLKKYQPLFERRREIIAGQVEPTDAEVKAGEDQSVKDDPDSIPFSQLEITDEDTEAGKDMKGIPEFWLTALRNHVDIAELITERDEPVRKLLHTFNVNSRLKPDFIRLCVLSTT
jgi:nucleosome assembly protein 1-like 1